MSAFTFVLQPTNGQNGPFTGLVRVTAHEAATCRKLVLLWACLTDAEAQGAGPAADNRPRETTIAKWAEWQPGQTYDYGYTLADGLDLHETGCRWYARPEVHLTGEFKPTYPTGWLPLVATPRPMEPEPATAVTQAPEAGFAFKEVPSPSEASQPEPAFIEAESAAESSGEPLGPVDNLAFRILFDQPWAEFREGEPITGQLSVEADGDYEVAWLGLYYQWLSAGQQERGQPVDIVIAKGERWQAGRSYDYPFQFTVEAEPSMGVFSSNLSWNLWPEVDTVPAVPVIRKEAAVAFRLESARRSEAPLANPGGAALATSGPVAAPAGQDFASFARARWPLFAGAFIGLLVGLYFNLLELTTRGMWSTSGALMVHLYVAMGMVVGYSLQNSFRPRLGGKGQTKERSILTEQPVFFGALIGWYAGFVIGSIVSGLIAVGAGLLIALFGALTFPKRW